MQRLDDAKRRCHVLPAVLDDSAIKLKAFKGDGGAAVTMNQSWKRETLDFS